MIEPLSMAKLVALAKKEGPHAALKAYKVVAPKNWAIRLGNAGLKGLPKPRPRIALIRELNKGKGKIFGPLFEAVGEDLSDPPQTLIDQVGLCLNQSRKWKRLEEPEKSTRAAMVGANLMQAFVATVEPSKAAAVAHDAGRARAARLEAKLDEQALLQGQVLEAVYAGNLNEVLDRVRTWVAGTPPMLHQAVEEAFAQDRESIGEFVAVASTSDVPPGAVAAQWVRTPPPRVGTADSPVRPVAWRILGQIAFAYSEYEAASLAFERAATAGGAPREGLLALAVWSAANHGDMPRIESLLQDLLEQPVSHPALRLIISWYRLNVEAPHGEIEPGISVADEIADESSTAAEHLEHLRQLARAELANWQPTEPIDRDLHARIGSEIDILDRSLPPSQRHDAGVRRLEAALEQGWVNQTAFVACDVLSLRAWEGASADRASDLDRAFGLALELRNELRRIGADSGPAVAAAARAAGLARRHRMVIDVGSAEFGEATAQEAAHPDVIRYVAVAASEYDNRIAEELERQVPSLPEGFIRDWCRAELLTRSNRPTQLPIDERIALWKAALESATTDFERVLVQRNLAAAGVTPADADPGSADSDWAAAEAQARAAFFQGNAAAAVSLMRPFRDSVPAAALTLAEAYEVLGERDAAIDELLRAAARFDYDDFVIQAARVAGRARDLVRGEELLQQVLSSASPAWHGRAAALELRGHYQAEAKDWPKAISSWEAALERDPYNEEVRWSLAQCYASRGDFDRAWELLASDAAGSGSQDEAVSPPDAQYAHLFLVLVARRLGPEVTVSRGLELLERFDDIEFHVAALSVMMGATTAGAEEEEPPKLPPELSRRLQSAISSFMASHPDHPALRSIPISPDMSGEEILAAMAALDTDAAERKQKLKIVQWAIARGTMPLGTVATTFSRPYAQVVAEQVVGIITASFEQVEDHASLNDALNTLGATIPSNVTHGNQPSQLVKVTRSPITSVVVDTTSLYARTLLPDLDQVLTAGMRDVIVVDDVFTDIVAATDNAYRDQGHHFYVDPDTGRPTFVEVPDHIRRRNRDRIAAMRAIAVTSRRETAPASTVQGLDEIAPGERVPWLESVRLAASRNAALWVDDVAVRAFARRFGVRCFSTKALLQVCTQLGPVAPEQYEAAVRSLIRGNVGDFGPSWERLRDIGRESDGGRASVIAALANPGFWLRLEPATKTYVQLLDEFQHSAPNWVPALAGSATTGNVGFDRTPSEAADQVAAILAVTINRLSLFADIPGILAASRVALQQLPFPMPDPLPNVARRILRAHEALSDAPTAAATLMGLMSRCSEEDKQTVRFTILAA